MRQLALDIQCAGHAVFDSFLPGPNEMVVASLRQAAGGAGLQGIWIFGPPDVGKSHLLQASVTAAHRRGASTAYLPLTVLRDMPAAVIEGMGALDLVAVDDISAVAGDPDWEHSLFRLHESLVPSGGRLLVAADAPPAQSGIVLADLRSRLCAAAVFGLARMTDAQCLQALQLRAAWRGFTLPDETGRFLLSRVDRDTGSLFSLLDRLDRAALEARKRLTVPFVRSVLDAGG
jgi:DnaA family protein